MDSYTITIAPNDDSGAATRLVVDTSGDQVRITDVHLHAPRGLSSGHIPTVDFDLLLQAVTGTLTESNGQGVAGATALSAPHGAPALEAATATEPAEQSTAPATSKGRARKTAPRAATTPPPRSARARTPTATSGDETSAPQRSARAAATSTTRTAKQAPAKTTGKAAPAKTPPAPARKQTATRATAPTKRQTSAKRTRPATTTTTSTTGGRVYRRTPGDLAAVFEQVGTVAGVAAHYQVPRYTAQGWVSRLRATT
jgi:hypothetical protein